ncbi:MAG: SusF/SusE family outer membrane protein [Bacteroidales bacterium]|nr:SusF/SusE family outer membrane protein [Bacteroidales bacterium]
MKKLLAFFIAAVAVVAVSCNKPSNGGGNDIDWSKVTVDGFYVAGEATGSQEIKPECVMTAGVNEAAEGKPKRDGMFEKYIVLEGGKEFYLAYSDGGKLTYYSAELKEFVTPEEEAYNENPEKVLKGKLVIGDSPIAMTVAKTGLYHIVLDINKAGDLKEAQILLLDASDFGVRGEMNSWGFTKGEVSSFSNAGTTFTLKDQVFNNNNAKFKFATGNYWKVTLDDAGKVKAETSLGETGSGLGLAADNDIIIAEAGKYDITLTFKLAQGDFNKSFDYDIKQTEKIEITAPETMYMNGGQWGGDTWDWNSDGIVELQGIPSAPGLFWCTRWFDHNKGFKFCAKKEWSGDFTGAGTVGYTVSEGNCFVAADGFYTVFVDGNEKTVEIAPAEVFGLGDAVFSPGGWDFDSAKKFTVNGQKMEITTDNAGELRLASKVHPSAPIEGVTTSNGWIDWWKSEFIFFEDGKIAYRGAGGDQARRQIEAGKKIILDFNAGTATVE